MVYFNPADTEHPIGYNPLALALGSDRALAASMMVGVFKKLYGDFWGPAIESWRDARWKRVEAGGATALYDWRADPRERDDRARSEADALAASRRASEVYLRAIGGFPPKKGPIVRPGGAASDRLEDLGYAGREKPR